VIDSQPAVLDADHAHSRETLTAIEFVPPSGLIVRGDASKLGWQRADVADDGAVTLVEVDPPHAATSAVRPRGRMNRQ